MLAGPRVYLAMATDGLIFRWMGALHPRYRTPHLALIAQAVWSSILVWTGTYGTIVSRNISRPPSAHLKTFYYDTVNFNQGALKLAIDFAGAEHILAGSDYPHKIGSIPSMLEAIAALPVTDDDRAAILGGNAARLLGLGR